MGELKTNQIYDPKSIEIYSIILDVSGLLSLICYPLIVFIMLTKSTKEMKNYKWQLIYYITCSYGPDFLLSLWKPIMLFPLNIGFAYGWTKIFGEIGTVIQYFLVYFIMVNIICANYFNMIYRLINMFGRYEDTIFKSRFNFIAFMLIAYIGANLSIVTPLATKRMTRQEIYNATVGIDQDLAEFLVNEHSTVGYDPKSSFIRIQQYSLVILLTLVIIIIAISWLIIGRIINTKFKKTRTDKTWKMTIMMGVVMKIQIIFNCIFLFTTAYFFNLAQIFDVPYSGPISLFMFAFASFHSFADTLVILFYIKPYRMYCRKILEKLRILKKKNQVAVVNGEINLRHLNRVVNLTP